MLTWHKKDIRLGGVDSLVDARHPVVISGAKSRSRTWSQDWMS